MGNDLVTNQMLYDALFCSSNNSISCQRYVFCVQIYFVQNIGGVINRQICFLQRIKHWMLQYYDTAQKGFSVLWCLLQPFPGSVYHTDGVLIWAIFRQRCFVFGIDNTWKTERKNLNFRTHINRLTRKTGCFSKDEQTHDNIIWNVYWKLLL
jgi:IS1 family transposase